MISGENKTVPKPKKRHTKGLHCGIRFPSFSIHSGYFNHDYMASSWLYIDGLWAL